MEDDREQRSDAAPPLRRPPPLPSARSRPPELAGDGADGGATPRSGKASPPIRPPEPPPSRSTARPPPFSPASAGASTRPLPPRPGQPPLRPGSARPRAIGRQVETPPPASEDAISEALALLAPRPAAAEGAPRPERDPAADAVDYRLGPAPPLDPASLDPASLAEALRILGAVAERPRSDADAEADTTRATRAAPKGAGDTAPAPAEAEHDAPAPQTERAPSAVETEPVEGEAPRRSETEGSLGGEHGDPVGDRPTLVAAVATPPSAPVGSASLGPAPSTQPSPAVSSGEASGAAAEPHVRPVVAPRHAELFREIEGQRRALAASARLLAEANAEVERVQRELVELRASLASRERELADARAAAARAGHAPPRVADDLQLIRGVGPTFARRLRALDIVSYAAIAAWTDRDVEVVAQALGIRPGRIRRDGWIASARVLLEAASASRG